MTLTHQGHLQQVKFQQTYERPTRLEKDGPGVMTAASHADLLVFGFCTQTAVADSTSVTTTG